MQKKAVMVIMFQIIKWINYRESHIEEGPISISSSRINLHKEEKIDTAASWTIAD